MKAEQHARSVVPLHRSPSEWLVDYSAAHALYGFLQRGPMPVWAFDAEVSRLGRVYGRGIVCAEVVFLLARVKLEPDEALAHWPKLLTHAETLAASWGYSVDGRVCLLSYFLGVERQSLRPTNASTGWVGSGHKTASEQIDRAMGFTSLEFFREQLRTELDRSLRTNTPLSFMVVDIDDLGQINDGAGREAGDAVLASLGQLLRRTLPMEQVVARSGVGEFVVLLPATPKVEAARIAEDLREAVAAHRFDVGQAAAPPVVTVSLGLATCPADARDEQGLIAAGDCALYQAKGDGKNRVCLFSGSTRSFARYKVAWPGTVRPIGAAEFPIQTVEFGEGGLAFCADRSIETGTLIEAVLPLDTGDDVQFAGRVAWSRAVGAGTYETAIQFIEQRAEYHERVSRCLGLPQPPSA